MIHSRFKPIHISQYNFLFHWKHICHVLDHHSEYRTSDEPILFPITVEVNPTNCCNHSCVWCFTSDDRNSSTLAYSTLRSLTTEFRANGVRALHFSGGGEPTLYPGLLSSSTDDHMGSKSLARELSHSMTLGLITNGSLLHALDTNDLMSRFHWIRISMDAATEERYRATHRTTENNLAAVIQSIDNLVRSRLKSTYPTIGCSFVFDVNTDALQDEITTFVRIMSEIGVDFVQIKPELGNCGSSSKKFSRDIVSRLAEVLRGSPTIATIDAPFSSADNSQFCWYCYFGPVVGASGSIYTCCYKYGQTDYMYGTVDSSYNFNDVWNSTFRATVQERIDPKLCTSCRHSQFNMDIERLFHSGPKVREMVSSLLQDISAGVSIDHIPIPDDLSWLTRGFMHVHSVLKCGYNRVLDFPVYRDSIIVTGESDNVTVATTQK